jgi:hypothetical protein
MNFASGFLTGALVVGFTVYVIMAKSICVFGSCVTF